MKVLNISRYLPIEGFPAENDITLKIYADLKKLFGVDSIFVMPIPYLPKWSTYLKRTTKKRYKIINNSYIDSSYNFQVNFFQAYFPLKFKNSIQLNFYNHIIQFQLYRNKLFSVFNKYKPDIIHAHTLNDGFYAYKLAKKYKCPYILTLRGQQTKLYNLKISKEILNGSKKIITPSYQLYNELQKEYTIELMPHGINKSWYLDGEKDFDFAKIRLVTTSRLLEMKNIQVVLQSLLKLKEEGYKVKYDIIGEGPYRNHLEKMVLNLKLQKQVLFHGHQDQEKIIEIYKQNDIFIMLSSSETFGRAYFEAAAQGLLIVGTKNTGADGYFNNEEAFFIEPTVKETTKVLKSINKVAFDTRISKSRTKILDFNNEIIIKKYNNILNYALSIKVME